MFLSDSEIIEITRRSHLTRRNRNWLGNGAFARSFSVWM